MAVLDLEAVAEGVDDVGAGQQLDPELLHVLHPARAVAQHAEADVHAAAGQRERPRVAGNEVGLEPHVQLMRRRSGDVAGVLAKTVPLTEVAGLVRADRLAHGAPHAVGGDHVASVDLEALGHHGHVVVVFVEPFEAVAVADVRASLAGQLHQRVVELQPWRHRRVRAGLGQRDDDLAAARRSDGRSVDLEPVGDGCRVEAEVLELAQPQRGQPVAAALVAREDRLVDRHHRPAGATQLDGGGAACRAEPDDHDVGDESFARRRRRRGVHAREATGAGGRRRC